MDSAAGQPVTTQEREKVQLAVYDFDGTCISGNSPVLLVLYLVRNKLLPVKTGLRIAFWGVRYKYKLPQNESLVRGLVFKAFCGKPASEVDDYLRLFYDEVVSRRWREAAGCSMRERSAEGCVTMVVSATWDAIATRAQEEHHFDQVVATKMVVDSQGNYTCRVDGLPIEGLEKMRAIERFANEAYGEGNWELAHAYGDHHSDIPLLAAARVAHAVTPDKPLGRKARAQGWEILEW